MKRPLEERNEKAVHIVEERRWRLAGHTLRLPSEQNARRAARLKSKKGRKKRGRPERALLGTFRDDLNARELTLINA